MIAGLPFDQEVYHADKMAGSDAQICYQGERERFYAVVRRRDGWVVGLVRDLSTAAVLAARKSRTEEHYVRSAEAGIFSVSDHWKAEENPD